MRTYPVRPATRPVWQQIALLILGAVGILALAALIVLGMAAQLPNGGLR